MANVGQSTFLGSTIVMECDENWTCCQREQARRKADAYNNEIKTNGPLPIASVSPEEEATKELCQGNAGARFKRQMKKGSAAAEQAAKNAGAPDCLATEIKNKVNSGAKNLKDAGIEMDHPVDVRFGGPANTDLVPLDREVNNAFGGMAKNVGNDMLAAGETEVTGLVLYCPPSKGCPDKDFSNVPPETTADALIEEPSEMTLRGKRS
jgi:hypothetical protein